MAEDIIHNYYSPNDLYNKIIEGLNKLGKDFLLHLFGMRVGQVVKLPGLALLNVAPSL